MFPEWKVSDLMVWITESLLVQVTVAPVLTVSVPGLKAKPWMLTELASAAGWTDPAGVLLGEDEPEEFP